MPFSTRPARPYCRLVRGQVTGKAPQRRALALCGLVLVIVAVGFVAMHLWSVHNRSYEYRWTPSPAAPRIQFGGRDYNRAQPPRRTILPAGMTPLGMTEGGGRIYGSSRARGGTNVVLYVVTDDGTFSYGLSGGP